MLSEMDNNIKRIPYRVGLLLIEGFAAMSYSATTEPLRAANLLAGQTLYQMSFITTDKFRVHSSGGMMVSGAKSINDPADYEMVLVIAGGDPFLFDNNRVFRWLHRLDAKGVTLGGVSGGPAILAAAGVMDGRRLTIHWEHADVLCEKYPGLLLEKTVYVIDRNRISCAGGVAPLDMMHALITRQHGSNFARQVSDWFMHTEVRTATAPQRSGLAERYQTRNHNILTAIEIMRNHLADPLKLDRLALLTGTGPRQLNRLFQHHIGESTIAFYRHLRLEKALNLLEKTSLTVTEIAIATGFVNAAHFATTFRKKYGVQPSQIKSDKR